MLKNPAKTKNEIVQWIREYFAENGPTCYAVLGISGGKDSTVAAALCVEALGKDRVIGVLMPNGEQHDIVDSCHVTEVLEIRSVTINIKAMSDAFYWQIYRGISDSRKSAFDAGDMILYDYWDNIVPTNQMNTNLPPRIRMTTLYAVSQMLPTGGRVCNTCNKSEDYVGYSTKYGDSAGDFAPLADLTVTEVLQIGDVLGLPHDLVHKPPSDGLCGKTDEDNLGFTYAVLDRYIETGECESEEIRRKIDNLHRRNLHKLRPIATYFQPCNPFSPHFLCNYNY